MRQPKEPLFLARQSYRRRRLTDAIRLIPVLGGLLFLIPVLNMSDGTGSTLSGSIYLFGSWLGLIVLSALLARRINAPQSEASARQDDGRALDGDE